MFVLYIFSLLIFYTMRVHSQEDWLDARHELYSATFYPETNCQGKNMITKIEFECNGRCFKTGSMRSVLLTGARYNRWPAKPWSLPKEWYDHSKEPNTRKPWSKIASRGPLAIAYNVSECDTRYMVGRARIPNMHWSNCVTFSQEILAWDLQLQFICDKQGRYNDTHKGDDPSYEVVDLDNPRPGDLDEWEEWEREHEPPVYPTIPSD